MADYYPLIRRAISGLTSHTAADRLPIYSRAREALERQLRSFDPPLAEEAILAELEALQGVIARIEAENAGQDEAVSQDTSITTPTVEAPPPKAVNSLPATSDVPPDVVDGGSEKPPSDSPGQNNAPAVDEVVVEPVIRPRVPMRAEPSASRKKLALFSSVAVILMVGAGMIALARRDDPARFKVAAQTPPLVAAQPERVKPDEAKTEGRLGSGDPAPAPASIPPKASASPERHADTRQPAPSAGSANTPAVSQPAVPAVSRAFMVLEQPGSAPNQFEGRANWVFSADPSLKGQKSLRAKIEFAGAGLTAEFSIARNADQALNASHTVMVIFEPGSGIDNIREMSAVEWRELESQNGQTLAGIVVPVQDNVFMIGLDKSEAGLARNLDLLRTQKWMVFEVRLANGRRGAVLAEKGPLGEKAIADALAEWK